MKKIKTLKLILLICLLILVISIGFFMGLKFKPSSVSEVLQQQSQIAIVNMDMGVNYNGEYINYAKELVNTLGQKYVLVNIESAKKGIQENKYSAYITFSGDFSKNITSINSRIPRKSEVYYELSPNLSQNKKVDINKEILFLQQQINDKMSYLYVNSILEEYSLAKNKTKKVIENDKKDFEAIMNIDDNDLITLIDLTDFKKIGIDVESLDMSKSFEENVQIANQFNEKYVEIMGITKEEITSLKLDSTLIKSKEEIKNATLQTINMINQKFDNGNKYDTPNKDLIEEIKYLGHFFNEEFNTLLKDVNGVKEINNTLLNIINSNINSLGDLNKKLSDGLINNQSLLLEYNVLIEYFEKTFEMFKDDEELKSLLVDKFKNANFEILGIDDIKSSNEYVDILFGEVFVGERKKYYQNYKYLDKETINTINEYYKGNYNLMFEKIEGNSGVLDKIKTLKIFTEEDYIEKFSLLAKKMFILDYDAYVSKGENNFLKNNNNNIKNIVLKLEEKTVKPLNWYKEQIDLYDPLSPYKQQYYYFNKLYNAYTLNNQNIQTLYKQQDNKNIEFVKNTYYNCDKYIGQLREDVLLQNKLSNQQILSGLNGLKSIKKETSEENINMMSDFSKNLPYINVETLKEKEIQNFITTPVKNIETFYSENDLHKPQKDNIEKLLILVLGIFTIIFITVLVIINRLNNKLKNENDIDF